MNAQAATVLRQLGSCGTSDVLEGRGVTVGQLAGMRSVTVARTVVGQATTVQLAPLAPGEPRPGHHLCAAAVERGAEGSVIVVAVAGDPWISGAWGGLLGLAAHSNGMLATVVAGLCRDSDELRELGYPVYALGTTPITARGRLKEVSTNAPVTIGESLVRPGDTVVADGDGVVVVPADHEQGVVDSGRRMLAAEAEMAASIRAGKPLSSVLDSRYEALTEPRWGVS